jgi:hypothetical protein
MFSFNGLQAIDLFLGPTNWCFAALDVIIAPVISDIERTILVNEAQVH